MKLCACDRGRGELQRRVDVPVKTPTLISFRVLIRRA